MPSVLLDSNGKVKEIFPDTLIQLQEKFHPDVVQTCKSANSSVKAGWIYDEETESFSEPEQPVVDLNQIKDGVIHQAFEHMNNKLEEATVYVNLVSGANTPFGCDAYSRENIIGINTAMAIGIPIDNPRLWTPKGTTTPVNVTNQEFGLIGAAILLKKDELYQIYFYHKSNISSLENEEEIYAYDFTLGY